MTLINYHPAICRLPLLTTLAWFVTLYGCGEEDSKKKPEPVYSIDIKVDSSTADGWTFQTDSATATPDTTIDAVSADSSEVDASDAASVDVPVDAGPVEVKSCKGKCGIKMESNPCHCDHACVTRGDCCQDFTVACTCETSVHCDDGNFCTTDSCQDAADGKKWCKQVPFFGCCNADSECGTPGKNKCVTPTCLEGSCSDVQKNCDDGVACTLDTCDPVTGDCVHKLPKTKCLIDGACHGAGASQPGVGTCVLCQPDIAQDKWTAKVGTCLINGICSSSGEKASPTGCRICNPTKATDAWSVVSGSCYIDGKCHLAGVKSPTNPDCATCAPSKSQAAWSGVSGKCAVGDKCYDSGAGDAAVPCAVCDPAKSASSLTPKAGFCVIEGTCAKAGDSKAGTFTCQSCVPAKTTTAWTTTKAGTACSDDDPCTTDTICTTSGTCKGKTLQNCCKSDVECIGKVNPATCEKVICKGDGTCATAPNPLCCTAGKCCDLTKKQVKPQGSQCSTTAASSLGYGYKCEGAKLYRHEYFPGCTGVAGEQNKCSGSVLANAAKGPWKQIKDCAAAGNKSCFASADGKSGFCK
ncbi:MAG: hypothetical protein KC502_17975 [Myxococcales bacterium]|nr:hypothetical protein [Myxococcales bacterium]